MKQFSQILWILSALSIVPAAVTLWNAGYEVRAPTRANTAHVDHATEPRKAASRTLSQSSPEDRATAPHLSLKEKSDDDLAPEVDEESLLEQLRLLALTNPTLSLELARTGDEHFPDGPTAVERSWFEARALVELGRFEEARRLAQQMVERYPNTHFAQDVQRHLLSHPMGQEARR